MNWLLDPFDDCMRQALLGDGCLDLRYCYHVCNDLDLDPVKDQS
ncbi:MAG: hypothetical protein ACFB2W_13580 [Leptolyngbyaceae cyanobacterium]